jgi:hypothetical protein
MYCYWDALDLDIKRHQAFYIAWMTNQGQQNEMVFICG